jgi:hypothetical protein
MAFEERLQYTGGTKVLILIMNEGIELIVYKDYFSN